MIKSAQGGDIALVSFELPAEVGASAASVCGDFNDWSPSGQPLARLEDGGFRAVLELPTGRRWRFRYLLDGHRWENDWAADDYIVNGYGSHDSVVDLTTGVVAAETIPHQAVPAEEQTEPAAPQDDPAVETAPSAETAPTPKRARAPKKPAAPAVSDTVRPAAKPRKRVAAEAGGVAAATPRTRKAKATLPVTPDESVAPDAATTAAPSTRRRRSAKPEQ